MSKAGDRNRIPGASIGLPVYNSGSFLKETLDLLLSQEYTDFELIISDNASTDHTEELCRDYAARDSRIMYVRRERNYGISANFKNVLALARAPYFMFAAHDDRVHPRFIKVCRERLEANPKLALATPTVQFITMEGKPMEKYYPPLHTVGMDLRSKVAAIFSETGIGFNTYGLYRRDILQKVNLDINCYAADVVLLLQLLFYGDVEYIPEKLFTYRFTIRTIREYAELDDPDHTKEKWSDKIWTVLTINLFRAILNAPVQAPFRRILLSDALGILIFRNARWRQKLLEENKTLSPFCHPAAYGLFPQLEMNLAAALSALLLPYCWPGAPFGPVDISDIATFGNIPPDQWEKPCPGHGQFVAAINKLIMGNAPKDALAFYDRYRSKQPATDAVRGIDARMAELRSS